MKENYFHFFRRQRCLLFLFIFMLIEMEAAFAHQWGIGSLQTLLKKDKEDANKVNHLNNLQPDGIYFLKIKSENNSINRKLIIQK